MPDLPLYLAVALAVLTGAALRGPLTADGLLLGLPAGLFWTVALALTTFLALAAYDAVAERERASDRQDTAGTEQEPQP